MSEPYILESLNLKISSPSRVILVVTLLHDAQKNESKYSRSERLLRELSADVMHLEVKRNYHEPWPHTSNQTFRSSNEELQNPTPQTLKG